MLIEGADRIVIGRVPKFRSKSKNLLKNKSLTSPYKMAPRPLGNINENIEQIWSLL